MPSGSVSSVASFRPSVLADLDSSSVRGGNIGTVRGDFIGRLDSVDLTPDRATSECKSITSFIACK